MSYANSRYGIYPPVPQDAGDWRLNSVYNFEKEIQKDIEKYNSNLVKLKKKMENLRLTSSLLTASATSLSITGAAISATVGGAIVGAPIVGFGTIVGVFSLLTLKMEKDLFKKIVKNEKLITLIYTKMSSFRVNMNKSLKDNNITEEEYKYIEFQYNEYKKMQLDVLTTTEETKNSKNKSKKELEKELEKLKLNAQ